MGNTYETKPHETRPKNINQTSTIMLKVASFISILACVSRADKANIDRQLIKAVANSSLRAFQGNIVSAIARLDEYGCWCYFYDNVGRGKGTPVDEIDGFCKTLADGYQCAMIDGEAENDQCVPWEKEYEAGTGAGRDRFTTCATANPGDNCAIRACSVEGIFVDNLFAFLISGVAIPYETYGHNDTDFDPATDAGCPVKKGYPNVSGQKECCGAYPNRFPYKTLDGARACCGSRTYNTELLNCCGSGQVIANC